MKNDIIVDHLHVSTTEEFIKKKMFLIDWSGARSAQFPNGYFLLFCTWINILSQRNHNLLRKLAIWSPKKSCPPAPVIFTVILLTFRSQMRKPEIQRKNMFVSAEKSKPKKSSTYISASKLRFAHANCYTFYSFIILFYRFEWSFWDEPNDQTNAHGYVPAERCNVCSVLRVEIHLSVLTWLNRFCLPSAFNNSNRHRRKHCMTASKALYYVFRAVFLLLYLSAEYSQIQILCFFFCAGKIYVNRKILKYIETKKQSESDDEKRTEMILFLWPDDGPCNEFFIACNEFFIQYFWTLVRRSPHSMFC